MNKFLKRYTDTIFIMLGSSCNLKCRYCLQQCQDIPQLPKEINPDIYEFIRECCEENGEQGGPILLQFYGGEPLLYFDKIKEVVTHTKYLNVRYSTISNGRALTKEMVDFFNEYDFSVTISWDGPNVMKTRKFDVLKENHDNIMALNHFGTSAVLSAESYPKEVLAAFDKVDEEYSKLHDGQHAWRNMDYIFDTGITDKALVENVDYDRMKQESYELTMEYIDALEKGEADQTKYDWQAECFNAVSNFYGNNQMETLDITRATCSNGYTILNMDLQGNLYYCHNIFKAAGSIYSLGSDFYHAIVMDDNSTSIRKGCNDCVAVSMCYGGCKLIEPGSKEKESYCKIRQAIVGGVVKAYIEYGKKHKDDKPAEEEEKPEAAEDKPEKDGD